MSGIFDPRLFDPAIFQVGEAAVNDMALETEQELDSTDISAEAVVAQAPALQQGVAWRAPREPVVNAASCVSTQAPQESRAEATATDMGALFYLDEDLYALLIAA